MLSFSLSSTCETISRDRPRSAALPRSGGMIKIELGVLLKNWLGLFGSGRLGLIVVRGIFMWMLKFRFRRMARLALFINRTSQTCSTNNLCPSPAIIFGHDVRFGAAFPAHEHLFERSRESYVGLSTGCAGGEKREEPRKRPRYCVPQRPLPFSTAARSFPVLNVQDRTLCPNRVHAIVLSPNKHRN